MESTDLIPMDGDVAKITKRAEEFRELPDALQRNLQTFLTLTMDILAAVHQKGKAAHGVSEASKQAVRLLPYFSFAKWVMLSVHVPAQALAALRKKSRSLIIFAGNLKYRMSPDVYSYLARLDVEIAL